MCYKGFFVGWGGERDLSFILVCGEEEGKSGVGKG